jgi:tetratricopeptide (TPR) repeat protein
MARPRIKPHYLAPVLLVGVLGFLLILPHLRRFLTKPVVYHPTASSTLVQPETVKGNPQIKRPGSAAVLPGATWVPQTFNNCGPATVAMLLQYFGYQVSQETTKGFLRTNPDDKNVFTADIQRYLKNQYGLNSKHLFNGNLTIIKSLITNGFYILVQDWLHPNEDIGHDTIIKGFDDSQGVLISDDSYLGVNVTYPYQTFEQTQWKPFNREYLVVYLPKDESRLKTIIGDDWDEKVMLTKAAKRAQEDISQNSQDMYAYFNLGSSYYYLGQYQLAADAFRKSQDLGWPKRMLWYQIEPIQTLNELGSFQQALTWADLGLWANDTYAELHYEKARSYKGLNNIQPARQEAQRALELSPDYTAASEFLTNLQ